MTSDTLNSPADVRVRPAAPGHYIAFLCARCGLRKDSAGRKLQRVQGVKTWVCRGCSK